MIIVSGCSPYEFECESGMCVDIRSQCDGIVHCNDGSDEHHCPGNN